jgi:hypothetical protein
MPCRGALVQRKIPDFGGENVLWKDSSLARRIEHSEALSGEAFADATHRLFPALGACSLSLDSCRAIFAGVDSPCTQVFGLGFDGEVREEDVAMIEKFFHERDAPVFIEVSPLSDPSLMKILTERGYRFVEFSNVFVRPLSPDNSRSAHNNISIRKISHDEAELWSRTIGRGFFGEGLSPSLIELFTAFVHMKNSHCFVAEIDGHPAGGAAMMINDRTGMLAGASTLNEFRKRGVQGALLDHRLALAAQTCDLAVMATAPGTASQRNAERNGFEVAYTRVKWVKEWK